LAKIEAMSTIERARTRASKVLRNAAEARMTAQQMLALDADERSRIQLHEFAENSEKNHLVLSSLIDGEVNEEAEYASVYKAITEGELWFQKKHALCKAMVSAANRSIKEKYPHRGRGRLESLLCSTTEHTHDYYVFLRP